MIALLLTIALVGAKNPTISELAKTERGYELPCGVGDELDPVPDKAEIADMHRWARQERDSTELESVWTQLLVRKALRQYLQSPRSNNATCEDFLLIYRVTWDAAAQRADRIYGSSRKAKSAAGFLGSLQYKIIDVHPMPDDSSTMPRPRREIP